MDKWKLREYWVKRPRKKKVCRAREDKTFCGKKVKPNAELIFDQVDRDMACAKCLEVLDSRKRGIFLKMEEVIEEEHEIDLLSENDEYSEKELEEEQRDQEEENF